MYIVEVIPIAALPPNVPQILSYFFNGELATGSAVEISIGNRKTPAIVLSSEPIEGQKIMLKSSNFQLKKISKVISHEPLVNNFQLKIALWLSKTYYAPLGICLKTVLPSYFLKKKSLSQGIHTVKTNTAAKKPKIILSRAKDTLKNIEDDLDKTKMAGKQSLILVPEISTAIRLSKEISSRYKTVCFYGKLSLQRIYELHNQIISGEAEIIIGTRISLFSPFKDLGLIAVEDPLHEAYKSDMTPKYNAQRLALKISEIYSSKICFVSRTLDLENYLNIKNGNYDLLEKIEKTKTNIKIVNAVQEIKSGNYSILSRELGKKIAEYIGLNKKILIFSSRKGYSTSLLCENCGLVFNCQNCSTPMHFHKLNEPFLVCHRCSTVQKMPEYCPNCLSYKIKHSGMAGSQKIQEEIIKIFPDEKTRPKILIFDATTAKDDKTQDELTETISNLDVSIVIATQLIFSQRYGQNFDLIGVPTIDGLTTIPDFRTEENLFGQFSKLLDFEPEEIIVQTYNPENKSLDFITTGDYQKFYEGELPLRKIFSYPPYGRLIKLSFRHKDRSKAAYQARILSEKLKMAIAQKRMESSVNLLGPSPAFVEKERGLYVYNMALKLSLSEKPENILKYVTAGWSIDVDPKSIL